MHTRSIYDRERHLAEKTPHRIAEGIVRVNQGRYVPREKTPKKAAPAIRGRGRTSQRYDAVLATATEPRLHVEECQAFLTKCYSAKGTNAASLFHSMPTSTAKARGSAS